MSERIDQITIIGGGTAGWLTALILQSFLNRRPDQKPVAVTVIESPTIPTIGVGEATVRGITNLLRQIGISERDFMRRCNATFKLAAEFVGWNQDQAGDPVYFLHPFNFPKGLDGINPAYHFLRYGSINGKKAAEALTWNQAIITHKKGPRPLGGKDYEAVVSYAYHLDAALFGPYLRETAVERGVTHIEDDVVDAEIDEKGHVASLQLQRNGTHPVKLVIDCTGFRSVILQGKLDEEFIPYSQHLLCDRAMPLQIKVPTDQPLPSATRATGLTGGWVFRVPLAERVGTGYIYSSQFKSDDEARDELIQHLRANGDLTPEMEDPEPKIIRMKTGRTRRAWVGNCIAIGLSNGFVEPLEATAIYMVESATRWLVNYFPDEGLDPVYAEAFNRRMDGLYDEVRDFLSMHFVTSNRPEPFWEAARAPGVAPERLMEQLRLWKHTLPSDQDMFYKGLFGEWNYLYCLWEKGYWDSDRYPLSPLAMEESWRGFERHIQTATQDLLRRLPDHRALLSEIRGETPTTQPVGFQPVAGTMMGVGGDGAWQAAQPVYQAPAKVPPVPPPSAQVHPAQMPSPGAVPYQQGATPSATGIAYDASAFGSQPYNPAAQAAPPPSRSAAPASVGLTFGAPTTQQPAAPVSAPPTTPSSSGLTFGAAIPGDAGSTFAAPLYGSSVGSEPSVQAPPSPTETGGGLDEGSPDAPSQQPAQAAKSEPSPFEKALAKRYGKRATVRTPR